MFNFGFKTVLYSLVLNLFISISYADTKKQCGGYLNTSRSEIKPVVPNPSLFNRVVDVYIDQQVLLFERQAELITSIRRLQKERSLPIKKEFTYPVPLLNPETLNLIGQWNETKPMSPARLALSEKILKDPYLGWLKYHWVDKRSPELRTVSEDLGAFIRVDGQDLPQISELPKDILGYIDLHMSFEGPMKLSPELIVFRMMRDHDGQLRFDDRKIIGSILELEKELFVFTRLVNDLSYFEYGTKKEWDKYLTPLNAHAELLSLKSKITLLFPEFSVVDFLHAQVAGNIPGLMTFEDYVSSVLLSRSIKPEHLALLEELNVLRNIVHFSALAKDPDLMTEEINARVEQTLIYYLY